MIDAGFSCYLSPPGADGEKKQFFKLESKWSNVYLQKRYCLMVAFLCGGILDRQKSAVLSKRLLTSNLS